MNSQTFQVLLIEDNPGDARLLREYLDPLKFHVTYAQRLSQATQYLDAAPSDVILLDLTLPDSAGLETVQRVQAHAPGIPIVVLTGHDDEALALEAMRHGAQDYLVKGQIESNLLTRSIRYAFERKRVGLALQAGEARYRLLAENATDVIWTVDLDMRMTYISPSVTRLLGFTMEEAMAHTMQEAYTPATFEKAMQMFAEELALERTGHSDPQRSRTLELELIRKDGGTVPVEANFGFLRDATGKPTGILAIVRDITERKHAEEQIQAALHEKERLLAEVAHINEALIQSYAVLEQLAIRDALTGLYNRREMSRILAEEFIRSRRSKHPLTLAMLDIDHFKPVNDTYGHPVGDQVLKALGRLLTESVRSMDRPVRYGGEEFAIVLPTIDRTQGVEMAERIRQLVAAQSFQATKDNATSQTIWLTVSLGVASFPLDGDSEETLIAAADHALYQAKRRGRNCVMPYSSEGAL